MLAKLKSAIWAACCAAVTVLFMAQPAAAQVGGPPHIRPRLELESSAPAPGQSVALALVMTPDKGWHGYWSNPGDAGVPLSIKWQAPAGVTVGTFAYPVPSRLLIAGLMNYVYEQEYTLLADVRIPASAKAGDVIRLRGEADWLACTDEVCVPERGQVAVDITVGDGRIDPDRRSRFDGWRAALPKPLGSPARFQLTGGKLRIAVPLPASVALDDPYFFPATERAVKYATPQSISRSGDTLVIETAADGAPTALAGVLRVDQATGLSLQATPGAVPAAGDPVRPAVKTEQVSLLAALGGALLGGLLLNVMPCVFPILSLKALGLARAGVDEATARREAIAYTVGVILTCLVLGGVLLALRAGGAVFGWAFQLQDPRVIALLLLLITAIALNLAGVFELRTIGGGDALANKGGAVGAFWTGALAAFVATPCTGPFMAVALGAALVLPAPIALGIFAGLGLGLALPFLAIGFVPALRRRLPRPGPWMETMRHILSVPMFLTALGLAWVLGRQVGVDGLVIGLGAALLLGLGLWWAGARQARGRSLLPAVPAFAVAAVLALTLAPVATSAAEAKPGALGARPFSEAALTEARGSGAPVFVYFTADWCITCKVNERAAIDRAEVAAAFSRAGVKVLVGDWTRGDPVIGRFLAAHGRSGVPLYLFYRPGKDQPEVLPQVLTPGALTGLVS